MEADLCDEVQDVAAREGAGPLTAQGATVLRMHPNMRGRAGLGVRVLPPKIRCFQARSPKKVLHSCFNVFGKAS